MIRTGTRVSVETQPWREILPHPGIMEQDFSMNVVSVKNCLVSPKKRSNSSPPSSKGYVFRKVQVEYFPKCGLP